jgi:hypothetical protein
MERIVRILTDIHGAACTITASRRTNKTLNGRLKESNT